MKRRGTIVAGIGGIGAAAALGLALVGSPAQAEDPSPSASSAAPAAPGERPDRAADRAQRQDELAAALATELGIDKAKVAAALEKVQTAQQTKAKTDRTARLKTRLDEAVKAGTLTSEQAAAILKASEAGVLGRDGLGGGRHGGGRGGFGGR
jgi:hypothetical protein